MIVLETENDVMKTIIYSSLITLILSSNMLGHDRPRESYFTSYLPNYFGVSHEEGETHIEFMLSLKYPNLRAKDNSRRRYEVFGAYTGLYDFYLQTRHSAPVVSRLQNVGLHYVLNFFARDRWTRNLFGLKGFDLVHIDLTVSHESNGQNVESIEEYNIVRSNDDPDIAKNADDYVSMSTNYLGMTMKFRWRNFLSKKLDLTTYFETRIMDTPGDTYFNDRVRDVKVDLKTYRRFNLLTVLNFGDGKKKSVQLNTNFYTIEGRCHLFDVFRVPIIFAAGFDNPMEISTYQTRSPYFSVYFNLDGRLFND